MTTLFVLAIAPASAQKLPPINLLQNNSPDPYTVQRRKEIESEYNSTLKTIPDKKSSKSDPWQGVRGSDADAKKLK
jgi:hypothetical protein